MKLILKSQVTVLLIFIIFTTACNKEERKPKHEMKINTFIPTDDEKVYEKVKNFHKLLETNNVNHKKQEERIEAGEALWLMEATGNYLYNRNAKFKKDRDNLTLEFELSFELEQDEQKRITVSKSKVLQELKILHRTFENRSSSMKRLPRLVDYEIASVKDGVVNFKVEVILVTKELRERYDKDREYGLPQQKVPVPGCNPNAVEVEDYYCADYLNLGYFASLNVALAEDYAEAVSECLEANYGQYFTTNVMFIRSHFPNSSEDYGAIYCYDDGNYDEYTIKGDLAGHDYYPVESFADYGEEAIDLWNGDICTHPGNINSGPWIPAYNGVLRYRPEVFRYNFDGIGQRAHWCVTGVMMGRSITYQD